MSEGASVTIVNPAAEDVSEQHRLAPRLASLAGIRIGLIDNSKRMADIFLNALRDKLRTQCGVTEVEYYRKTSPSVPTPPDVIQRLTDSCDAVIHGVAD